VEDVLSIADVEAAADRIAGAVRPIVVAPGDDTSFLALEYLQHTGTFKARGAWNFVRAHLDSGALPAAGVTIASGGNAGVACAWAAAAHGVRATVFVPETAPTVKVRRLESLGADVRAIGVDYAQALAACHDFAATTDALVAHAYDHPLIAAGAGTLMLEILETTPDVEVVVVAVGGGGLFAGVATAASHHGVTTIGVEPAGCRALNATGSTASPFPTTSSSALAGTCGTTAGSSSNTVRRPRSPDSAVQRLPGSWTGSVWASCCAARTPIRRT
jgi:threonine dehydratase